MDWNNKNRLKAIIVLIWAVSNFVILNIVRPGGLMAYILPSILWGSLALYVAVVALGKIKSWSNMQVTAAAVSVAFIYILVLLDIGFFSGFGRNSQYFNLNVLPLSFMMMVFTLLGMEFSRAFLVRELGRKKPFLAIAGTAILFSIFSISMVRLLSIGGGLEASKFMGSTYLPLLAGNILASYLVAIGGPIASLAYLGPLKMFWWFSPLLPHLSWGLEALLGVMIPIMGYLIINRYVSSSILRKVGMHEESKGFGNKDEGLDLGWVAIPVVCVLVVWFSTGLVGVHPTTIMSGSMRPSIDVGDMVLVRDVNAESVVEGDIVQYWNGDEMVVHRVVDIEYDRNERVFVTKGDANSTPDSEPVTARQIQGEVMFTVPMIGWLSIGIKSFLFSTWAFLSTNSYVWVLIGLGVLLYFVRRFSSRMRISSWKRSGGDFGKKAGILAVVLLVGTASSGFVYSHWAEKLNVNAELETGSWSAEIGSTKTYSDEEELIISKCLSGDKQTFTIEVEDVDVGWTVWIGLKVTNESAVPLLINPSSFSFNSFDAEDNFDLETYYYGAYHPGYHGDVWPPAHNHNLPANGNVNPPIYTDPHPNSGDKTVFIWTKIQCTGKTDHVKISEAIVDEVFH